MRFVEDNPEQPRAKRAVRPEPVQSQEGTCERLLGGVLCFLTITQNDVRGCERLVLVAPDELTVRADIPVACALDELTVIRGGRLHGWMLKGSRTRERRGAPSFLTTRRLQLCG